MDRIGRRFRNVHEVGLVRELLARKAHCPLLGVGVSPVDLRE
jgi:hypothetical protein